MKRDTTESTKIITLPDCPSPISQKAPLPLSISLLLLISADGEHCKTSVISHSTFLPQEYAQANSDNFVFTATTKKGMDSSLFFDLFKYVVVDSIDRRRKLMGLSNFPSCLHMDSATIHTNKDVLELAKENGINIVFPPSHTSHIVQPFDKYVNANMKKIIYTTETDFVRSNASSNRFNFVKKLKEALSEALKPSPIEASFRDSGIWPLNPEIVLKILSETSPVEGCEASINKTHLIDYSKCRIFTFD